MAHMVDGRGLPEISVHIAAAAEGIQHPPLIVIGEESAPYLVQAYIHVVVEGRDIRYQGRPLVSAGFSIMIS